MGVGGALRKDERKALVWPERSAPAVYLYSEGLFVCSDLEAGY